ncbi:uncharacterized protein AMSG_09332 [Thecamonas trahens ATCC 50062]|uniref:CS domain-containing protein n=1 Tax=Thecamonas trahens ATCC 50062 TaxID=461836 RepID=A0A0L0DLA0_THETB|nr:hypothetical protein AMSG_09332 [Thecamonas trahens ATCC 50062]KNC53040.1 hypothetical protein AMSG_09332 [Thecamonas trahens ATCC 50062]|eukprot:XP_013754718.1 hypothetical protein AMSG_09332 [Thecamonas trahens ATCC 50062]
MSTDNFAPIKWAQRKDRVFLTIALQDVKDEKISLTDEKLEFEAVAGTDSQSYKADIEFFEAIDAEKSSFVVRPRQVEFLLMRKEEGSHWPRLTKNKLKAQWLNTDWSKYVDSDEEDEADDAGLGDFGMGGGMGGGMPGGMDLQSLMASMGGGAGGMPGMPGMPGMGGMGGMPGMGGPADSDDDSDDGGIPGLDEDDGPPPLED